MPSPFASNRHKSKQLAQPFNLQPDLPVNFCLALTAKLSPRIYLATSSIVFDRVLISLMIQSSQVESESTFPLAAAVNVLGVAATGGGPGGATITLQGAVAVLPPGKAVGVPPISYQYEYFGDPLITNSIGAVLENWRLTGLCACEATITFENMSPRTSLASACRALA